MTTRWGLDLDMSAVRLMRRDGDTWIAQTVEKIDSPDIEDRLSKLISPIGNGEGVMLFLPREQILYTQIELDARGEPKTEIERAMEGRTPYRLEELSIDWEATGGDRVFVAAIARDTLDEAAAFAEVRNLKIAGYSTLFSEGDFPRLPDFDGPNIQKAEPPAPSVAFTTARVPSRPPEATLAAASAVATAKARFTPVATPSEVKKQNTPKPVLEVNDPTPVVQVKAPQIPLDPGIPISAPNAPPRIRSDIGAASVSGHAASLTPPGGAVRVHKRNAPITTLAVFAVAFLLTIGVAVLVWNVLPMRPGATANAPLETGAVSDVDLGESQPSTTDQLGISDALEETPDVVATEPLRASDVAPLTEEIAADFRVPIADAAASFVSEIPAPSWPVLAVLTPLQPETLPEAMRSTPELKLPSMTASLQSASPFLGPLPDTGDSSDDIFFSAFEVPEPATDAIALPSLRDLSADSLPTLEGATLAALPSETVPADDPVASAVEQALTDALVGPGGLIPTDIARGVAGFSPRARPNQFTQQIERQRYGGRSLSELASLRPPARPESAQSIASLAGAPPTELAVSTSLTPQTRPSNIAALINAARVQAEAARVSASAALTAPDTSGAIEAALEQDTEPENRAVRPRILNIPTTASVARQATIENAIRLNRINLVGVYGAPSDRRALVRLSSGRYIKVKVGDRVDGGTVAQITDSELYYRKGSRTLSLQVPQG
ncbi:MAG: hypothetical protein AAF718_00195 [Pseudomonadota bacterium]